jgi:hypothetical protein
MLPVRVGKARNILGWKNYGITNSVPTLTWSGLESLSLLALKMFMYLFASP